MDDQSESSTNWGHITRWFVLAGGAILYCAMFFDMGYSNAQSKISSAGQAGNSALSAQLDAANWAFWASAIAAAQLVATVIGLIFIRDTLEETRKAVRDTSNATKAMETGNHFARQVSAIELRAYLVVHPRGIERTVSGSTIHGNVEISNIGKTPAQDVSCKVRMVEGTYEATDFPVEKFKNLANRTIMPGGMMVQSSKNTLSAGVIEDKSTSSLYVWGFVEYTDHEGHRRSTNFCHRYNKSTCEVEFDTFLMPNQSRMLIEGHKARIHIVGNEAT